LNVVLLLGAAVVVFVEGKKVVVGCGWREKVVLLGMFLVL